MRWCGADLRRELADRGRSCIRRASSLPRRYRVGAVRSRVHTPRFLDAVRHRRSGRTASCRNRGPPAPAGSRPHYQDHIAFDCVWEFNQPPPTANYMGEATVFWPSAPGLDGPGPLRLPGDISQVTPENIGPIGLPSRQPALCSVPSARPKSRGRVRVTRCRSRSPDSRSRRPP